MAALMSDMNWREYATRIAAGQPLILPIGALEQHGYHMPMAVDTIIPLALATEVANRIGAVVAPPIAYGYKSQPRSGGGQSFPGTSSLDGLTLIAMVRDLLREFARHGCRKIALLSGHFENSMFVIEGIDLALRDLAARGVDDLKVARIDYWEFITPEVQDAVFDEGFPGWPLEHASIMETSVMLHLCPHLVDLSAAVPDGPAVFSLWDTYPEPDAKIPPSGVLSTTRGASSEKGKTLFECYAAGVEHAMRSAFSL